MKIYKYSPDSGLYLGSEACPIDKAKTLAIKATVYKDIPQNYTHIAPPAEEGWAFIDGAWFRVDTAQTPANMQNVEKDDLGDNEKKDGEHPATVSKKSTSKS